MYINFIKIRSLPERTKFIFASVILVILAVFIFYGWGVVTSARLYDLSNSNSWASGAQSLEKTINGTYKETGLVNEESPSLLNEIRSGLEDMTSLVTDGVEDLGGKVNPRILPSAEVEKP